MRTQLFLLAALLLSTTLLSGKNNSKATLPNVSTEMISDSEETAQHSALEIEDWMTDDSIWNINSASEETPATMQQNTLQSKHRSVISKTTNNDFTVIMKTTKESAIRVEDWMTDDGYWKL